MITRDNINEIYRKYKNTPESIDELDLATLFDETAIHHDIMIDPEDNTITFGSIDPKSPFHTLPLDRINAILGFEEWVAVVMHSSILFLNRKNSKVVIDIKPVHQSFGDRISRMFRSPIAC
ncbi:MAG: hypothetical protein J1F20_05385 [Muribaculaceae bacterium]|nr:hypothetical protein [Muribaculaceae bacterium]